MVRPDRIRGDDHACAESWKGNGREGVVSVESTTERRKYNNFSRCPLVGEKGDEWTGGLRW